MQLLLGGTVGGLGARPQCGFLPARGFRRLARFVNSDDSDGRADGDDQKQSGTGAQSGGEGWFAPAPAQHPLRRAGGWARIGSSLRNRSSSAASSAADA